MSILKGTLNQYTVYIDQEIDLKNVTAVYLQNNGSKTAYFGTLPILAGKTIQINLGLIVTKQSMQIRFDSGSGTNNLFVMLSVINQSCN